MVMESFLILIRMVLLLFFYHLQIFQFEETNNTNLDQISLYKRYKLFTLIKPIKAFALKKNRKNLLIFRTVPNHNFLLKEQHLNLKHFFKPKFSIRNT